MYDVAILGGGPAGITAAIYCARYKLKTLLLSYNVGGWVNNAYIIENLPFKSSIPGSELVKNYKEHIKNNDIDFKKDTLLNVQKKDNFVITSKKASYEAKFVVYALGTKKRMLKVPGEGKFLGKGVHTCATCDAPFYRDEQVAVVGGNDGGAKAAMLLSEYAKKIYIVEVQNNLPMEPAWKETILKNEKIEIITGSSVKEFQGEDKLNSLKLTNGNSLDVSGVFIEIGSDPNVSVLEKMGVKIDKFGCVMVDYTQKTSIDGLYAAGDLTNGSNNLRQIITAQAEGAVAAQEIYKHLI
ncbi:MAG: NAD(P)/FAD-dependent oxidoreductase [Nanobdellota archaeon]